MVLIFMFSYLAKKEASTSLISSAVTSMIVFNAILSLYFLLLHPKITKGKLNGGMASFLSFISIGLGQAYNRQLVKSILFLALYLVLFVRITKQGDDFSGWAVFFVLFVLPILSMFEANYSSGKMNQRLAKKQQKKQLEQRAGLLTTYHENNHQFAVDTNILMHDADLLIHLLGTKQIKLIISSQVFKELDGLKNNKEKLTRMRAQLAFDVIEAYQRKGLLKLIQVPTYDKLQKLALSTSADEKIIATYLYEFKNGANNLLFLSNDKGARIIARNAGMPVAEV